MGFTQVLAVLKSRRRALFAVWGGVVVLALVVSLVLPRQYLASAEVVVEPRGGDQLASQPGSSGTTPGFLATQADIIASERVGARAVAPQAGRRSPLGRALAEGLGRAGRCEPLDRRAPQEERQGQPVP